MIIPPSLKNNIRRAIVKIPILISICTFSFSISTFSQISTSANSNAQQLAQAITGKGYTISNAKLTCPTGASGTFINSTSNINLGKGILLTSGGVDSILGISDSVASVEHFAPGDPKLAILAGDSTFDACALEFDLTPSCDVLKFKYVFASEEYPDYVGSINDVFAFFISGPGITDTVNMATLPNSTTPVSVNTVNDTTNSQYFVNNDGGTTIRYNGFTVPLTASIKVIPCSSYHLKMVISDAGDDILDSGVFIEGNSLDCTPPELISPPVCASQASIDLCAPAGYTYQWPAGQPGAIPPYDKQCMTINNPKIGDVYTVNLTAIGGGCPIICKITLKGTDIKTTPDTICEGNKATISASGGVKYLWNTGDTTSSISVSPIATTSYTVQVTAANCPPVPAIVTVTVSPKPKALITGPTNVCIGSTIVLTASGGTNYLWNTGKTTSAISVAPIVNTNYSVIVSQGGCSDTTTTAIVVNPLPVATASISAHTGTNTQLNATGGGTYNWVPSAGLNDPNIYNPVASPSETTQYCVYVTNPEGCSDSACVNVVFECDDLFIPTAFSPNNDGVNEMECVLGNCFQTFLFTIYDRWGEKVFETDNSKICWDGFYKGKLMNTAVFVYYLKATLVNGKQISRTGNVSLIR